jgi:hypothetical protein
MYPNQQFAAAIGVLRQCGFFESFSSQTDAQVAATLLEGLRQRYADDTFYQENPQYRPDQQLLDRFAESTNADDYKWLATQDCSRVWTGDLEADVCASNRVYEQVVQDYARLSMNTLQPTAIIETWHSEEGPVTLSFDSQGQRFTTELAYYDDWIDGEVFSFLDSVMHSQGFSSAIHTEVNTGQDVFFVRATEKEKTQMEQLLGWSFDWQTLMDDSADEAH